MRLLHLLETQVNMIDLDAERFFQLNQRDQDAAIEKAVLEVSGYFVEG